MTFSSTTIWQSIYPNLYRALDLVYADGMPAQIRETKLWHKVDGDIHAEVLREMDKNFSKLSPDEMEIFCQGDETDQESIRDKHGLQKEHQFLHDFFEADCGEISEEVSKRAEAYINREKPHG